MRFVIITGLSGAGKSEAMKCLEDLGYFCVDNLPPVLLAKFAEVCLQSGGKINRVALAIDIRGGDFFNEAATALENLEAMGFAYEVLYLEADEKTLIRRFKESRRRHPLSTAAGSILEGIRAERRRLEELRGKATRIIDTSNLGVQEFRRRLTEIYGGQEAAEDRPSITVLSFGFKHGVPLDADLVFDVRFLPNPHYVESLHDLDGNDPAVTDYVMKWPITARFLDRLQSFLEFLLPYYHQDGRAHLLIAIGCTGGRHRSVVIANQLALFLNARGYRARVEHRDIKVEGPWEEGE